MAWDDARSSDDTRRPCLVRVADLVGSLILAAGTVTIMLVLLIIVAAMLVVAIVLAMADLLCRLAAHEGLSSG
jgi:hypothetical protein